MTIFCFFFTENILKVNKFYFKNVPGKKNKILVF